MTTELETRLAGFYRRPGEVESDWLLAAMLNGVISGIEYWELIAIN